MDAPETTTDIGILPQAIYPIFAAGARLGVSRSTMKRCMREGLHTIHWRGHSYVKGETLIEFIFGRGKHSNGNGKSEE